MARQATLKSVAELSGVSVSTVSRILNNRKQGFSVRDETRRRVLEAAEKLDYRPDPIVRTIRAKQTNLISILGLQDFGSTFIGTTEDAITAFAQRVYDEGYELCTNVIGPNTPLFAAPRWRVDGALVLDCPDGALLEGIDTDGVPYMAINSSSGPNGSSVTVDDERAGADAATHLIDLGHARIAFVSARPYNSRYRTQRGAVEHVSLEKRFAGYQRALTAAGLSSLTTELPLVQEPVDVIRDVVLEGGATGLVVYHHEHAVRLLRAAADLGLSVPDDLSIVCFNDSFPCSETSPPLTTMAMPGTEMGEIGAELLVKQIRGELTEPEHRVLRAELVVRGSTGPMG